MQKRSSLAWLSPPRIGATAVWLSCVGWTCHTEDAMKNGGEPAKDQSVQYDVRYVPGGMDRVILTKRDNARNLCVQVTLVSPTPLSPETPTGKLQLPPDWTLDRAIAVHDAGACRGTMRSN